MATTTRHMATNIEGLLRNMKRKKINFMLDDNGKLMTDQQARIAISELQAKGHKLIPSGDCEGFDPFGGGCPGHVAEDKERKCYKSGKSCKHGCLGLCKESY